MPKTLLIYYFFLVSELILYSNYLLDHYIFILYTELSCNAVNL